MRIAAQYADEWNVWGSPEALAQKGEVLERHCSDVGRDPREIRRTAQALIVLSSDQAVIERVRAGGMIAGGVEDVKEKIGKYVEAKVDEFIVPDFTLGRSIPERKEAFDRFIEEVAPEFR